MQIKHGPIDFQVREPASPLAGALEKTNQCIELQITQEYMGRHVILSFWSPCGRRRSTSMPAHQGDRNSGKKALAAGKTFHRPVGGFVGVSNVGLDELVRKPPLPGEFVWVREAGMEPRSERLADGEEWTRLTFGGDSKTIATIQDLQLTSWHNYENYTGPLGPAQTLTDITGKPLQCCGGGF